MSAISRERGVPAKPGAPADIHEILRAGALSIVFHPVLNLHTQAMLGTEALARLNPDATSAPLELFAQASTEGMLAEVELLAIEKALFWLRHLPPDAFLFVNASPRTLTHEGFHHITDDPTIAERIVVEISADASVPDYVNLTEAVAAVRARGAKIAIDDMGVNRSSLSHLAALGPDVIKLGPAITQGIPGDSHIQSVARHILAVADDLNAVVVAEAIEEEAELIALRDIGVEYGQGFYFGQPASLA